ncbi:hypothetical protein [Methanoculleus chikugoensis]|uniref:hypothetical protein n=1 Tax=Methanoculleus chikugoensis TaxID=118126 RepID=UPI0006CF82C9|nr:hypothetical protein [Methanoculleus chikugoensis]
MTFGFYALILTALLLPPYNAVGGAAGTAVRNGGVRRDGTSGAGERARWVGIGIGTGVIGGSSFVIAFLGPLILGPPLAGGFIAGYSAGPRPEDGLEAGLVAGALRDRPLLDSIPLDGIAYHGVRRRARGDGRGRAGTAFPTPRDRRRGGCRCGRAGEFWERAGQELERA